eukprot:154650_1
MINNFKRLETSNVIYKYGYWNRLYFEITRRNQLQFEYSHLVVHGICPCHRCRCLIHGDYKSIINVLILAHNTHVNTDHSNDEGVIRTANDIFKLQIYGQQTANDTDSKRYM